MRDNIEVEGAPSRGTMTTQAIWKVVALVVAVASLMMLPLADAGSAAATVHPYRTDGQALNMRSGPGTNHTRVGSIPVGRAFTAECHVANGQSINGNPVWLRSVYGDVRGWVSDYYVDTRWRTAADLTAQGIPPCGSSTSGGGGSNGDSVWVGAPFAGNWPTAQGCPGSMFPSYNCSLPGTHWWLRNAPQGDWAADLQGAPAGTPVRLYAAPNDGNVPVTAKVDRVRAACGSGRVSDGGYMVTVGLFVRGSRVGWVTYAHVNLSVSEGATINRWGTQIGTVGSGYNTSAGCWTGPHVHFQAYAQSGYSCYNRGWAPGQPMNPSNFLGFVTGRHASGPRQACP